MKYSAEQMTFLKAKEQLEVIKEKAKQIATERNLKEKLSRKDYAKAVHEIEIKLGYDSAFMKLVDSEQNLMKWAHDVVKRDPKYNENKADMENLFQNYIKSPSIREKLIDLALKLELSSNTY